MWYTVYSWSCRRVFWVDLTTSLVALSPLLLAQLLGLMLSGVVSMLLVCPVGVWFKKALSPLVLSPENCWEKLGHPC